MNCIHLDAPCDMRECAMILIGGKRGNKDQKKCYTDKIANGKS